MPSYSSGLGSIFNDSTRAPVSSLGQNLVEQGGQGLGSINNHNTNDLATVHNGLLAQVNSGQFSGAALGHVQAILSDINTAISTANATVNGASTFGSAAVAEQALRASNLDVINTVNTVKTDAVLSSLAAQSGAAVPGILPEGTTAATAPHANLAEIGVIFNDAANQILSGVTDDNRQQITDDINAVITDMEALMSANPQLFSGLTGVHADAVVRQLQLELTYINDPSISPDAAHASTDNILDIIDIIQGDANLADMATQDGISGFSPFPDAESPAPTYLDNAAQTVFVANFIAQSNSLGQQAIDLVGSGDTKAIATLIDSLKAFEKYVTDFDAAHGGNELLGAEIAAMIKGLQTGDANLVTAAADQMHGNAADAGNHNVPVTGGTYNTEGVTAAEVLGAPATTAAAPALQPVAAPTISVEPVTLATADFAAPAGADQDHSPAPELAHHLHYMWG
ncbi:hypothetical protein IVB30_06425 [Bradyrhizobium sp. 200]|uniref:hypothetical protein n=1 Tax=Bradyrhizobium sp. 200 TaxID=2782665 RepID=UPI001FFFF201|nr:hypothetical protein [Bradyrhizobium sp. 200]UPJ50997.1 hypothetical protein IVB30_06425 [Bradyrhizobium sp. 200]